MHKFRWVWKDIVDSLDQEFDAIWLGFDSSVNMRHLICVCCVHTLIISHHILKLFASLARRYHSWLRNHDKSALMLLVDRLLKVGQIPTYELMKGLLLSS